MDSYVYIITALLPLAAAMVIFQVNPYHALVIRGVLGAIAALVYTVLGAADVALTEALVGTLLAITLYAIAVRSSLVLRLGVVNEDGKAANDSLAKWMDQLTTIFSKYYLRVEPVVYGDRDDLDQALVNKEVHVTCTSDLKGEPQAKTRLRRLHEIMKPELLTAAFIDLSQGEEKK
jgi:putative multicomponent Na+:H+ antiporter subunit B